MKGALIQSVEFEGKLKPISTNTILSTYRKKRRNNTSSSINPMVIIDLDTNGDTLESAKKTKPSKAELEQSGSISDLINSQHANFEKELLQFNNNEQSRRCTIDNVSERKGSHL
jgi:hypothetical protein